MANERLDEAELYLRLSGLSTNVEAKKDEDLRTTPLLTLAVKNVVDENSHGFGDDSNLCIDTSRGPPFQQYAVLGFHAGEHPAIRNNEPILLNVDAPNSAFICGSQGSGKSYTLNCMLENCLIADKRIGRVSTPVAGLAFQYDPDSTQSVAETAYLCSMGVRVRVLVSQSNEYALRKAYSALPEADKNLTVAPLLLRPSDLSIERMHKLMAFTDKGASVPLYMSSVLRILRQMATNAQSSTFDYLEFKEALESENFTKEQTGPLKLRLDLLESFMDFSQTQTSEAGSSIFDLEPGTLTIIDLTDPFMDSATACILFEICLSLVKERRPSCGLVVALDEAHKFMTTSSAASNLTDKLLGIIREQRHSGTRVIIATQEPTISEKLLDLCTTSIIHRFTSPAWYSAIQKHLGAASNISGCAEEQHGIFNQIMSLNVGESLVFAPSAFICLAEDGAPSKLGRSAVKMLTRRRLGTDGGMSVLASTHKGLHQNPREAVQGFNTTGIGSETADGALRFDIVGAPVSPADSGLDDIGHGGVAIKHQKRALNKTDDDSVLRSQSSHLILICCFCKGLVVLEFPEQHLPKLAGAVSGNVRSAIAYATCATCRFREIPKTKKASKDFDHHKGNDFRDGSKGLDVGLQKNLQTLLQPMLLCQPTVLHHKGHVSYLYMRVVQRTLKEGVLLWTARIRSSQNLPPQITFRKHQDGVFFDSSLQPEGENAQV